MRDAVGRGNCGDPAAAVEDADGAGGNWIRIGRINGDLFADHPPWLGLCADDAGAVLQVINFMGQARLRPDGTE